MTSTQKRVTFYLPKQPQQQPNLQEQSMDTTTFRKGDEALTAGPNGGERVTVIRAEFLNHPAFVDVDGPKPARRERWLHVRFADGARLLTHPSNLVAVK